MAVLLILGFFGFLGFFGECPLDRSTVNWPQFPEGARFTLACGGGVAGGSDNAIVRETCEWSFFLGLAVMQVCGDQVPGAPSDDSKRVLYLYYLGGSFGNRVSGYSAAAGIGIQSKG